MRVAFVGAGQMGGRMAAHVAASGHELTVFDTRPELVIHLVAAGARAAASPADAVSGADVVSVVVRDDSQVLAVTTGPDGVLSRMRPDSVLAIHSTVTLDCLRRVDAAASTVGVRVLDAGISGGVGGAEAGTLLVIVGGDHETIEAARPALAPWSSEIVHVGPIGAGMAAKVARNFVQYACFAAVHEAQSLAQAAGVDLAQFGHIVRSTEAIDRAALVLQRRNVTPRAPLELGERGAALVEATQLGFKDLDVAEAISSELGVELASLPGARAGFGPALGVDLRG
jgi:3-hydroxyisobutyrate dehydrogenase-like beta-hydroxyacid dehydrogenase